MNGASFIFAELLWNEKLAKYKVVFCNAMHTSMRSLLQAHNRGYFVSFGIGHLFSCSQSIPRNYNNFYV